jgi:uncharacterized protein
LPAPTKYITDLNSIADSAQERAAANDRFLRSLNNRDAAELDVIAHKANDEVSAAIDCTACGNCCKTLVINVAGEEIETLAKCLNRSQKDVKEQYIEESQQGNYFISTIPCHFLSGKKCTIYENRFTECRDFPHLHKPGFKARLAGTLNYYGMCPIIYNVIERMKTETGFLNEE